MEKRGEKLGIVSENNTFQNYKLCSWYGWQLPHTQLSFSKN